MRFLFISGLLALVATAVAAQDVTLTSRDGAIELSGTLIGFDGEFYRVDSLYGPLTVSADGVSCTGPGCPDLDAYIAEARFAGAAIIADTLLPALIDAFALDRDLAVTRRIGADGSTLFTLARQDETIAARFHVTPGTSEDGFLALLNQEADLALTLREPLRMEELAARAAVETDEAQALSRRARIIGLDALVPVTSRANPIRQIAPADLVAIFTGEIETWADLGGVDAPIALHLPIITSGLAQAFSSDVLASADRPLAPGIIRHADLRDLSDAVARDPYAIGITTFSTISNARSLALAGECGFSVRATPATLKSEDYPLTTPLFVYTPPRRLPRIVREFLGFFETAVAERVVRRAGFVSQSITLARIDAQGQRLANAILAAGDDIALDDLQRLAGAMAGTARLSPTFRFSGGASQLDTQSLSALSRLARAIEQGDFDGRTLTFVGFSDAIGAPGPNLALSRNRAETVRRAVIEAAAAADLGRVRLRIAAFGEALPVACDDTAWGTAINRRVEVWLD